MKTLLLTIPLLLLTACGGGSDSTPIATLVPDTGLTPSPSPLPSPGPTLPPVATATPSSLSEHVAAFQGTFTSQADARNSYVITPTSIVYNGYGDSRALIPSTPVTIVWTYDVACNATLNLVSSVQGSTQNDFNVTINYQSGNGQQANVSGWKRYCENPIFGGTNGTMPITWTSDKCFTTADTGSADSNPNGTFCKP